MMQFIRDALTELEHVVWPTPKETRKYMTYNIVVIVGLALFLMVIGYLIQTGLFAARAQFPHQTVTTSTADQPATQADLDALTKELKNKMASGATQVATGVTVSASGTSSQQ